MIKHVKEFTEALLNSCCDVALEENVYDEAFFKKSPNLENLPINNQNLEQLVIKFKSKVAI